MHEQDDHDAMTAGDPALSPPAERWRRLRPAIVAVALVVGIGSRIWLESMHRTPCGRYAGLDGPLPDGLGFAANAAVLVLVALAAYGSAWEGVIHSRLKRVAIVVASLAIALPGIVSWEQTAYVCPGH